MDKRAKKQPLLTLEAVRKFLLCGTVTSCHVYTLTSVCAGLLLSSASAFPLVKMFCIGAGVLVGFHFHRASYKLRKNLLRQTVSREVILDSTTEPPGNSTYNINTNGGNYTGNINGNYVQGDWIGRQEIRINWNQDLPELMEQFQQYGDRLKEDQAQILFDLRNQISDNFRLEQKLVKLASELKGYPFQKDASVAAEVLVDCAVELVSGRYQKLHKLLQKGKWTEADFETARLIFELCGKDFDKRRDNLYSDRHILFSRKDINKLRIEDLKRINILWVNASNGRFGFSVQRQLWEKNYVKNTNNCENFSRAVGWHRVDSWLHYSDLQNPSSNLKGCFPAIVMMSRSNSKHMTCQPNKKLLRAFMERASTL